VYIAGLPGVDAKQFAGDPRTRRTSNRLVLPAQWQFSTGASPGKSVEIFVLAGHIELGDIPLGPGGYAYLPPGSFGMNMRTRDGAMLLYFLDDADPLAAIQTPYFVDSTSLDWQASTDDVAAFGLAVKQLRTDPGSGASTRLLKIEPGASLPWQKSSVPEEGYLVSGIYQHSECVNGEVATATYTQGGYFKRPADAINGGADAGSVETSVWFLRILSAATTELTGGCEPVSAN
jgi:quercetin dioxygenase-like cupin family protein